MTTPAEDETTGAPITFEWLDVTVALPPLDDVDLDVLIQLETGRSAAAVRGIVGAGWAKLQADFERVHGRRPKVADLPSLLDAIGLAYGFKSAGE